MVEHFRDDITLQTHLYVRTRAGQRANAIAAFKARRVFEECAEAITGFLGAEILLQEDAPDHFCIIARWQTRAAMIAWMQSPVRAAQDKDLAHFAAEPPVSRLYMGGGYALATTTE